MTIAATFTETRDNWGSIMPCYIMHELDIGLGITRYLISMKDYVSDDCLIHDAEYSAKAHCYFLIRVLLYPLHEMRILCCPSSIVHAIMSSISVIQVLSKA